MFFHSCNITQLTDNEQDLMETAKCPDEDKDNILGRARYVTVRLHKKSA
jgi:hypothetical protein